MLESASRGAERLRAHAPRGPAPRPSRSAWRAVAGAPRARPAVGAPSRGEFVAGGARDDTRVRVCGHRVARGGRGLRRDARAAGGGSSGVHARRRGRRLRIHPGRGARTDRARPAGQPHRPGAGGAQPAGLEGDRVRGSSRLSGYHHRHLRHGEHGSDGGPHRRLDRGRAHPDPARPTRAVPAPMCPQDRPRPEARGRLQRAARRLIGSR